MNRWLRIFLPFALGYWFSYFVRNVNAVIVPELSRDLGITASDLGFLTSVFLLAFSIAQLPLGLLLDRFGARRVEAVFLLVAAWGCSLFALGATLLQLAIARALIGIGVAACLMAAFKAFGDWFGHERQSVLNASIMLAGVVGGLTATSPLAAAVTLFGWRGIFIVLAVLALLTAAIIFSIPDPPHAVAKMPLRQQVAELHAVLASRMFWRYALPAGTFIGGFVALQGLWAVPWLMQFSGLSRNAAAHHLLLMSLGLLLGYFLIATRLGWAARHGLSADRLLCVGLGFGLCITLLIILGVDFRAPLWFTLGLTFSVANLMYSQVQTHFDRALAGRANTALNLMVFVGAFGFQWSFGAAVEVLQAAGHTAPIAYQITFAALLTLQAASWLWLVL
ncbi:MAG: MFS transporter [Burkholderiales bacterium]|nr:MFS transporter [Burkholderiales bacterium]